ncbi:MAG: hypothetical protein EPN84_06770 [Legionella sp.]|nr:MAG: hypothetical protein EPN84_06770 [Legionella sp.]
MFLRNFTEFTLNNSGAAGEALHHYIHQSHAKSFNSFFFQTYESHTHALHKSLTILSGPLLLSAYALNCVVQFLSYGAQSISLFLQGETDKGGEALVESILYLLVGLVTASLAFVSPLINLVDLGGSGISSLMDKRDAHSITNGSPGIK